MFKKAILTATGALATAGALAEKPNVLLIVADDLGKDVMGCYGGKGNITPNLDALAKDGVLFNRAHCTSSSSAASRAVILTGMYGHAINCYGHNGDAPPKTLSLPVLMRRGGYRVGQCGKLHVSPQEVFDFGEYFKAIPRNEVEMTEACREFITADSDKPFFLYFCPVDPHRCNNVWDGSPYKPNMFGNLPDGYKGMTENKYTPQQVEVPWFLPDTPACRAELAQYCQSVNRLDMGMGYLTDMLKKSGKYDNTLIMFISDNGIAFPGAKTNVYEPAINLPLIVKLPGSARAGAACESFVNWADLLPTIAEMAGVPASPKAHGRSFAKELTDAGAAPNRVTFASHVYHEPTMYYPMRMIRKDNYKLIVNLAYRQPYPFATDLWTAATWQFFLRDNVYKGKKEGLIENMKYPPVQAAKFPGDISVGDYELLGKSQAMYGKRKVSDYIFRAPVELYDLAKDPMETKNLASSNPALVAELLGELHAFQSRTSDPWLIKTAYE